MLSLGTEFQKAPAIFSCYDTNMWCSNCELTIGQFLYSSPSWMQIEMIKCVFQVNLLGFSNRYCLRMKMVEFCQESTSPLTAAVSCRLLASSSFRVSNSFRLTHCPDSSAGEKFNHNFLTEKYLFLVFVSVDVSHQFVQ